MTPIARLLAAAEVNLAAASRRAVEGAVTPLKIKGQELVSDTLDTVAATVRTVAIKAGLAAFAGVMLIVAVVLALMAAYGRLADALGPTKALLVLAGAFLLLAVLGAAGVALVPAAAKSGKRAAADRPAPPGTPVSDATARVAEQTANSYARLGRDDEHGPTEQALNLGLDTLVSALGEAGFRREQAGLRAGLAMARQLKPMQIASLALLGGFVMGARMRFGRRRG